MKKIYGLYKRIMKRDPKAIDEIESLDEAKAIIKMMAGNVFLSGKEAYKTKPYDLLRMTGKDFH